MPSHALVRRKKDFFHAASGTGILISIAILCKIW
jgi:hypothetical protein